MITSEALIKAGWKKMGNAWYPPSGTKGITNYEGKWQLWKDGKSTEITKMEEI